VDRITFDNRLREAATRVVLLARKHVQQILPDEMSFHVYPNLSYDDSPRVGDETVFPDESLPAGNFLGPWSADQVVEHLWRGGKIPGWIDARVEGEDGRQTFVALECCGRFTVSEELLYHQPGGLAPFSIKSPWLPPDWESIEKTGGRFDLYWGRPRTETRRWWRFW
jgi:hypothetical protein